MTDGATSTVFGPEFDVAQHDVVADNDDDLDWLDDEGVGEAAAAARAAGQQPNPSEEVPQQPAGQEASQAPPESAPSVAEGQQPAQGPAQAQPEQQTTQQAPTDGAGNPLEGTQFKDVPSLIKSYNELRKTWNQTLAERQRDALEKAQLQAELEQYRQPQQEALSPEQVQQLLSDPQQLQEYINRQIQAGTQQQVQTVQQQQQLSELQGVAQRFMERHPEVLPESPVDSQMGHVIEFFQTDRNNNKVYDLFPVTDENIEVAYKLATDPNLFQVVQDLDMVPTEENLAIAREALERPEFKRALIAIPDAINTEEGLDFARQLAGLPGLHQQAIQQAQPPTPEQQRLAAHVETGGTGAPLASAPGQVPKDEFDEDVDFWEKNQAGNVFGLQTLG